MTPEEQQAMFDALAPAKSAKVVQPLPEPESAAEIVTTDTAGLSEAKPAERAKRRKVNE